MGDRNAPSPFPLGPSPPASGFKVRRSPNPTSPCPCAGAHGIAMGDRNTPSVLSLGPSPLASGLREGRSEYDLGLIPRSLTSGLRDGRYEIALGFIPRSITSGLREGRSEYALALMPGPFIPVFIPSYFIQMDIVMEWRLYPAGRRPGSWWVYLSVWIL
jgi:hypothetical protein